MFVRIIDLIFIVYTIFLFIRIIGSWIPNINHNSIMKFISFYTDPYLSIFRKIIPPIGGTLDLSPMLGFLALKILKSFLISLFG